MTSEATGAVDVTETVDLKSADSVSKLWFYFAMIWFPIFTTFGMIMASR